MRINPTTNFLSWCNSDKNLIGNNIVPSNIFQGLSKSFLDGLRRNGLCKKQIRELLGDIFPVTYTGYAYFSYLRYVLWSWPNGDKILYPLNSNGDLYIGTDNPMWCSFWPFLSVTDDLGYQCSLKEYEFHSSGNIQLDTVWLGGQSHFGHFVANFMAPFMINLLARDKLRDVGQIYIPTGYTDLHKSLIRCLSRSNKLAFHELTGCNGVYSLNRRLIVPALSHSLNNIANLKGCLEKYYLDRNVLKGKRVFISRSSSADSDRLYRGVQFSRQLTDHGFIIINPLDLTFDERLLLIGDADWILTESGSCSFNAYLFGNINSTIRTMIPKSILTSNVSTELNMLTPMLDSLSKGSYFPIETHTQGVTNRFYDICYAPTINRVLDGFKSSH